MNYHFRISQDELKRIYENAQSRMEYHPEYADKHKKVIDGCSSFKTEKEALESALKLMKENHSNYQIWAKVEKIGDIYRIKEWWMITDDNKIKQSADYIGLALMYDDTRMQKIISDNVNIDDIVSY